MKFVSPVPLLREARAKGYAIPAFNTNGASYDIARAALEAAQEMAAPLILQVYEPNCAYRGFDYFVNLANFLCDELKITIPVALQLDHGHSVESVTAAMDAGFTAVMFDASHAPLDENIAETRAIVDIARQRGVAVEAEVGYVKGNEASNAPRVGRIPVPLKPTIPPTVTSVEEAVRFGDEVDIDMLAVSVGTTHGVYEEQTTIDFDLLKQIRDKVETPLVQHGTCGISPENLTRLVKAGMCKVNFGEPFRFDYIRQFNTLTDSLEHLWHPWKIQEQIKESLKVGMKELIRILGAASRA
jgi:tagatose 1,6-diphosphate aldolase GatY/KbaY